MNQQDIHGMVLSHRTYGMGTVTALKGDRITLRFEDGTERVLSLAVSVSVGALTAVDAQVQEWLEQFRRPDEVYREPGSIRRQEPDYERIVFCNIAWMKWYQGVREDDDPRNGGAYVKKYHDAGEALNFQTFTVTPPGRRLGKHLLSGKL